MSGINIKLNGALIRQPLNENFQINSYNLTKAGRVASGKMMMDLLPNGKKRKFEFTYPVISGAEMSQILAIIDTNQLFFTIEYTDTADGIVKSATVYVGEINKVPFRTDQFGWYWKDVKFNLIEQ
jgi:hypothetical protein